MSLLMDALKRAEQEKREAAKRLKEAQGNQDDLDRSYGDGLGDGLSQSQERMLDDRTLTQELSTEDVSLQASSAKPKRDEPRNKLDDTAEINGLTLSPVEDRRMVLEDIDDSIDQADTSSDALVTDPSLADEVVTGSLVSGQELSFDSGEDSDRLSSTDNIELEISEVTAYEKKPGFDQTLALTTYTDEEIPAALDEITRAEQEFEEAGTGKKASDEYEYFNSTVSAAQLAKDMGKDSPTPVAAQTVFTATAVKSGSQIWQWSAFAVLCLAIAVSLSFFIFNYTVPIERTVKSPSVARDIETQSEPMPAIELPEEFVANADVDSRLFSGEISDVIENQNNAVLDSAGIETEADNFAENEQAAVVDDQLAMAEETTQATVSEEPVKDSSAEMLNKTAKTLPEEIMLEPKLIKISRSKSVDKRSVLINLAYEDYLAGDYIAADAGYREVLKALPENRDALLGLAAISMRNGQMQQAYSHYLNVLKLYPGDSVAEAALINFKNDRDQTRNESTLKTFLQKEPGNSFLHFSLGRLYALQKRWSEAQKSFFDAYSIETSNPDYAFNLAVSLDHIGQQQSAMDYYQTALALAELSNNVSANVGFDKSTVIARINALSSTTE